MCPPAFVSALYQHSFQKTEHKIASVRVCMSVRASGEHAEGMCMLLDGRSQFCWISLQASFWVGSFWDGSVYCSLCCIPGQL